MKNNTLVFIQKSNSHIRESAVFFPNGLGAFILDFQNGEYEIIPVIGNAENNKPVDDLENTGNLYSCVVKSLAAVYRRLDEIESFHN